MCLVRSWKTSLWAIWIALWLSQWRGVAEDVDTPKSLRSHCSQSSLDVVSVRARYSALVLEWDTWVCFLLHQEINNQWWTCDQWDLLPNQHQKMHGEQEENEQSRKGYGKECPLDIEECVEQQHNESVVEQTNIGSPGKQHRKCLDEWQWDTALTFFLAVLFLLVLLHSQHRFRHHNNFPSLLPLNL